MAQEHRDNRWEWCDEGLTSSQIACKPCQSRWIWRVDVLWWWVGIAEVGIVDEYEVDGGEEWNTIVWAEQWDGTVDSRTGGRVTDKVRVDFAEGHNRVMPEVDRLQHKHNRPKLQ